MENFVSFELAKKIKEKGFSCECPIAMYNERGIFHELYTPVCNIQYYDYGYFDEHNYIAPTFAQVLKWLRVEKKLHIEIYMYHNHYLWEIYNTEIFDADLTHKIKKHSEVGYATCKLAVIAAIEYVLDNFI